jgi:membrane protease YdiL (CAAX protease family)
LNEYIVIPFFLVFLIFTCVVLYISFANRKFKIGEKSSPFWFYLIAFTAAEILTALLQPFIGLLCHSVIFITLLIVGVSINETRSQNLTIALSLVPLIRIMSLSMPLVNIPQIYWFLLIYFPLFIAAVVVMWMTGLTRRKIGLISNGLPLQIGFGIVTGIAFGIVEFYILRPQPLVQEFVAGQIWLPALILLFTTGLIEEIIFRGVLQQIAEPAIGRLGLVYVSTIFAILHIGQLSILDIIFVFIVALIFAAFVKRTGSLIGVTLSHSFLNIILYLIAPFILG